MVALSTALLKSSGKGSLGTGYEYSFEQQILFWMDTSVLVS